MKDISGGWENHYKRHRDAWAGTVKNSPEIPAGSAVLEAGCGNGKYVRELCQSGVEITAFDFSENATCRCRETVPSDRISVLTADCIFLPFKSSVFDIALYRHVTSHLKDNERKISAKECLRVLKDGGMLYFTGFSIEDMRAGKGTEIEDGSYLKGNGIMTHYFSEGEAEELFSDFETISLETIRWSMRVRGTEHIRAEISGAFRKKSD